MPQLYLRLADYAVGISHPWKIPHYTKEYCAEKELEYRTTAEAAADLIRSPPLPEDAGVVVLGDTAYDANVVHEACEDRGYIWIVRANPERVYEGPTGQRPKVRSRLKDSTSLSLKTIRLRASTGKICHLPASFQVACWAETETTRVLRLSGKMRGVQLRPRATRFFDN